MLLSSLLFGSLLILFVFIYLLLILIEPRTTCLGNSSSHSELCCPTSTSNKGNASQICPQANLI